MTIASNFIRSMERTNRTFEQVRQILENESMTQNGFVHTRYNIPGGTAHFLSDGSVVMDLGHMFRDGEEEEGTNYTP
ncbi:MAG: hypothetical protein F4203_07825 [Rhodobacteraceae bacterium]|nr:hypothetical protein [Paracoccaceae bacterium]MYG43030.1 hypothetical protein [Paracoccaceae bacterium]